jgi:hypothetical protein
LAGLGLGVTLAVGAATGRAAERPALAHDWPSYHGPNGDFSAPCAAPLVDDLNQARLLWVGEETGLGKGKFATSGWEGAGRDQEGPLPGGNASPIVHRGLVIVSCFRPSGEVFDRRIVEKGRAADPAFRREFYLVEADEVVVAMDALTGETVWKQVAARAGLNRPTRKRGGWGPTPAAGGGRVFTMTTMGHVKAWDVGTGKPLWTSENGAAEKCAAEKAAALKDERHVYGWGEEMNAGLTVLDDVVLVPDWASGLVGLDAATGRRLWHRPGIRSAETTPTPCRLGGRGYAAVADRTGTLRLIALRTGEDCWCVGGLCPMRFTLTCSGDLVFVMVNPAAEEPGGKVSRGTWAAYRITPQSAERLWVSDHACSFTGDHGPQHLVTAAGGRVTLCCGFRGPAAAVDTTSGKTLQMLDVQGAIGHVWGDRRVFRSEPDGDGIWRWFAPGPAGLVEGGTRWDMPKHGGPTYGYIVPIIAPFVDGLVFQRGEQHGGCVRCFDLRRPGPAHAARPGPEGGS